MVISYSREAYLVVSLPLSCDRGIYSKLVEDMVNIYAMGQDNYPQTLPKMKNLLSNCQNIALKTPRPPARGLAFDQELSNNKSNVPTRGGYVGKKIRGVRYISTVKCYNCNH